MQVDKIILRNINVKTIIGTLPEERHKYRTLSISIELFCNLAKAGHSDNLCDTINYVDIEKQIIELGKTSKFFLIEKFAEMVAQICLLDIRVNSVIVTIDKVGALKYTDSVAVQITRNKESK
jgi:FolB domain-containing protein